MSRELRKISVKILRLGYDHKSCIPHLKNDPNLRSTKVTGDSHGWGHQIVEKIVSDYHGMIDFFEEFGMFGVQIIIPVVSESE